MPQPTPPQPSRLVSETKADEAVVRVWTDNTGQYQTVGKLVKIGTSHVRLVKENGNTTTVARSRLSQRDLDYVNGMEHSIGLETLEISLNR